MWELRNALFATAIIWVRDINICTLLSARSFSSSLGSFSTILNSCLTFRRRSSRTVSSRFVSCSNCRRSQLCVISQSSICWLRDFSLLQNTVIITFYFLFYFRVPANAAFLRLFQHTIPLFELAKCCNQLVTTAWQQIKQTQVPNIVHHSPQFLLNFPATLFPICLSNGLQSFFLV